MKKRFIALWTFVAATAGGSAAYLLLNAPASLPVSQCEEVQYRPAKGKGLVNIRVGEDVFLGIGMITGRIMPDGFSQDGFTGSISFEMPNPKPGFRVQIDRIRLVEKTPKENGRSFGPFHVYDEAIRNGNPPRMEFLAGPGQFPVVWKSGRQDDYLFFVFPDLPADLEEADLVLTYNAMIPGKKRLAYYEDRLAFRRKGYLR